MRGLWVGAVFILLLPPCTASIAQVTPPPTRVPITSQRDRAEVDLQRRMAEMRALEQKMRSLSREMPKAPAEPQLSSEERSRILRLRHVDAAHLRSYASFLNQEHAGIFKLFPDLGCKSKDVISVSLECERQVPLSSAFTFRTNSYGDEIYHDIHFKGERVVADSFFEQGIFGVLGDEPVENVNLLHPALKYLTSYSPDTDAKLASEHADGFRQGMEFNGYRYADSIDPQKDVTYAMRLIAYRLENRLKPLTAETTMNEMMFLSLAVDKRLDAIVIFRILDRDEYGGLTIVWKELSRSDAAKLRFGKNQPMKDFRPDRKQL